MNEDEKLLKLQDVKDWLKIGTTHVYELVKQGRLKKPLKQGRSSCWKVADIKEYISNLQRHQNSS